MLYTLITTTFLLASPSSPVSLSGGEPCQLIENLPGGQAPIRRLKVYRKGFKAIDSARGSLKKLSKARKVLEKSVTSLLLRARRTFKEKNESINTRAVRRFLDQYVYGKTPALVLRDEGFELPGSVSTTLAWLHCREGDKERAITYARPANLSPGSLVSFAALLLLDKGRRVEALELRTKLGTKGFLAPYIQAELAGDFQEKLRFHRMAQLRITTEAQRRALFAQRQRHPKLGGP